MSKNKIGVRRKIFIVFAFLTILFVIIGVKLFSIQIINGDEWASQAESNRTRELTVAASRGVIYDRNYNILAISLSADSIYVNPSTFKSAYETEEEQMEIATQIADILGLSIESVYNKLTSTSAFEWIQRKADFTAAQEVVELNISGIDVVDESMRYYPKGTLASHILGYAGVDNQGLDGIELTMESVLAGTAGSIVTEYDAYGVEIPQAVKEYIAPEDGNSIVLTIDENIQYFAERELEAVMNWDDPPASATIIIMDPNTGEILALANSPDYDPNSYGDYDSSTIRNQAVSDVYEPGSTFKLITASAALDSGSATVDSTYYCPGYYMIGNIKLNCWRYYNPHGMETFIEALQNSCNPALAQIALDMEEMQEGTFYEYIYAFGFGSKTGIDLPGEASGILIAEEDLTDLNITNISIGQSIAVTPIQMVAAVSAIVNGGILLEPQIVKEVIDDDGNVIESFEVVEVGRVISEETSDTMREIMEAVVSDGTAQAAYIEGYRVGGKTGTGQVAEAGGYAEDLYVASFIGAAPMDDPQIVCLVIINEPSGELYQGGQVAAPVFALVVEDVLRYLGVVAQTTGEETSTDVEVVEEYVSVPSVVNLTVEEAETVLSIAGLTAVFKGEGDVVVSQTPGSFSTVVVGTEIIVNLEDITLDDERLITVPDLTGMNLREAAEMLAAMGLKLESSGAGTVVEQSPIPGTQVLSGEVIKVIFDIVENTNTDMVDDTVNDAIADDLSDLMEYLNTD